MMGLPAGLGIGKPASTASSWYRFDAIGAEQTVVVPDGYTSATCYIIGAAGGQGIYAANEGNSGAGGYTQGVFSVTAGETLRIRTGSGGIGGKRTTPSSGGLGGYPGGGSGAFGDAFCGGGGGYSGVFRSGGGAIAVAGGGGGGSGYGTFAGAGGGAEGESGQTGASGGTQTAGGAGAYPGSAYQGGNANGGNRTTTTELDCGGGGGGYFGGAASNVDAGAGAGGSGYVGGLTSGNTYVGARNVRPMQIPSTINGQSTSGLGVGRVGAATTASQGQQGGNGCVWIQFS